MWLDDHVAKQRTKAHVEVASFHNFDLSVTTWLYRQFTRSYMHFIGVTAQREDIKHRFWPNYM